MLVDSTGFQSREDVSGEKFFAQVFHDHLCGAGRVSFLDHRFEIVPLANVADHGDDVVRIVFLQPRNDDRGIEAAGISKDYFLRHERSLWAGERRRPTTNTE